MMEAMSEAFPPSLTFLTYSLFAQQICCVVENGSWGGVIGPKPEDWDQSSEQLQKTDSFTL